MSPAPDKPDRIRAAIRRRIRWRGDRDAVAFFALGKDLEEAKSSRAGWLVGART